MLKVETTFTPGPWHYVANATIGHGETESNPTAADDRLMTAAPELYEALRAIMETVAPAAPIEVDTRAPIYVAARAALAKAEGR